VIVLCDKNQRRSRREPLEEEHKVLEETALRRAIGRPTDRCTVAVPEEMRHEPRQLFAAGPQEIVNIGPWQFVGVAAKGFDQRSERQSLGAHGNTAALKNPPTW
jgi:hypothetical protein